MIQNNKYTQISGDLAAGVAEIHTLLSRLCKGDTSQRAEIDSESDIFSGLKLLINQLADNIQESNDYTHDLAIGLCEHYDTLNRISRGDFAARAPVDSKNEMISKLGELINQEADTLTDALTRVQQTEEAMHSQLQFSRVLLDTIPNPIFYKDAECRYLGCNKAFETYVGLSQQEIIGKTPHEIWSKDLADGYRHQDLALLENPGLQVYETVIRAADGSLHDVIFNKATFEGKSGEVAGLVAIILDVTERKASENATKSAYQQLHDIVDFLPDATLVIDKEKRVIAWNRAIEEMTGLKKEEVIGKGDYIYSIPFYGERRPILIDLIDEDVEVLKRNYSYINVVGNTLFAETYIPTFRNGGAVYLSGTATSLFDSHGNQVGGIESIRDITEYKLAVEDKNRLESRLEHARLMETVMNRLGHDLKTPLTPLFVMLPLIRKHLVDPHLIKKIDMCIKCAATINTLADKTRTLARLSNSVKPGEMEGVSLTAIVDQALAECAVIINKKQMESRNNIDPAFIVRCVPAQFHELFTNLVTNSVQFSGEKSIIMIAAERYDETLLITVRDEGVGIDSAHVEHVFDEFFKADESRHDLEASGLGLSICKRIVQNHRGRIWAESPGAGLGTTIKISLNEQIIDCIQ